MAFTTAASVKITCNRAAVNSHTGIFLDEQFITAKIKNNKFQVVRNLVASSAIIHKPMNKRVYACSRPNATKLSTTKKRQQTETQTTGQV